MTNYKKPTDFEIQLDSLLKIVCVLMDVGSFEKIKFAADMYVGEVTDVRNLILHEVTDN